MKDSVKELPAKEPVRYSVSPGRIAAQILVAAAAFLLSRTNLFGGYLPFGLAAVAGAPSVYTASAAVGALAGYFFPVTGGGVFKYITAVFAIASIKWLILGAVRLKNTPLIFSVVALGASLATGFATLSAEYETSRLIMICTESVLAGGGAYFLNRASCIAGRARAALSGQEMATVVIAAGIVLSSVVPIGFGNLSLGRAVLFTALMAAAKYGGASAGAVAGTAAGLVVGLTGGSAVAAAFPFAASGLLAGVFSAAGKFASAAAGIMCFGLWVLLSGGSDLSAAMLIEAAAGSLVFLLLPAKVGTVFADIFSPSARLPGTDGLRRALVMRLSFASQALCDVSQTVEEVADRLSRINEPGFDDVLKSVEQEACSGCSLRVNCWETARGATLEAVLGIAKAVETGQPPETMIGEAFSKKCLRLPALVDSAGRHYATFLSRQAAARRLEEVRSVVTDQFYGISEMLEELSAEFERAQIYDVETAAEIAAALKRSGVIATECGCCTDKYGRMSIEIRIRDTGRVNINRRDILQIAESVCDRSFDPPSVTEGKKEFLVSISEKAVYSIDFGACQFSCGEGRLCGDAYEFFHDGRGRAFMVISDGMGTGGRAAVDGSMASGLISRLIKAGFGFDCALRIVNSAMLFKSTDESFATIDIASIDLFTGKTEIYKAGAAPTLVRRGGKIARAECNSLPAGILKDIGFDRSAVTVGKDDIIVMISDGAAGDGTDWICAELEAWRQGSASALADHLAQAARRRRRDGHEDDVTVLTAIVHKAV